MLSPEARERIGGRTCTLCVIAHAQRLGQGRDHGTYSADTRVPHAPLLPLRVGRWVMSVLFFCIPYFSFLLPLSRFTRPRAFSTEEAQRSDPPTGMFLLCPVSRVPRVRCAPDCVVAILASSVTGPKCRFFESSSLLCLPSIVGRRRGRYVLRFSSLISLSIFPSSSVIFICFYNDRIYVILLRQTLNLCDTVAIRNV
ncbi:hypothetical protein BJ912DRAFT_91315 [Pholiota molesta]|nr:hypothetical protein BJ912DRAFT_91315 [Pholiota molesta]